eukprot:425023_1
MWHNSLPQSEVCINIAAIIIYAILLFLFAMDCCCCRRSESGVMTPTFIRAAIIICIIFEISYPIKNIFDYPTTDHIHSFMSILFDILIPMVLSIIMMRIFNNYYTLRYLKLPIRYFICCLLYTISWWVSIPIEIFAIFDDNNKYYKAIYKYYLLTWICIEFVVFCCLIGIIIKLKLMLTRTEQYQSMFVINKQQTTQNKKNVINKLSTWMAIVFALGIYFLFIMFYYISISYILKLKKSTTFPLILYCSAHFILFSTLYYYCHSAYTLDATVNKRERAQTWVTSMISARANNYDEDEYEDDDDVDMEFSISDTSTIQQNENDYTQIMLTAPFCF